MTDDRHYFQPQIPHLAIRGLDVKGALEAKLAAETQLGITLADLTDPEYFFLRGGRLMRGAITVPAVAAQQGFASFVNGSGGSTICIVDAITIQNTGAAIAVFVAGLGSAVAAITINVLPAIADDRQLTAASVVAIQGGQNAAPVLPPISDNLSGQINTRVEIPGPWMITGNQLLNVICTTVNTPFTVTYRWRERPIGKSEQSKPFP